MIPAGASDGEVASVRPLTSAGLHRAYDLDYGRVPNLLWGRDMA
jgi:hypothetical protein